MALGSLTAGGAGASTSESVTTMTTGGYSQTDQFVNALELSNNVQSFVLNGNTPNQASELGVTVSSTTGAGGAFAFEQNVYRLGTGSAELQTTLLDTITNSSPDEAFLRFDSQITPGHIAAQGNDSSNVVFFQFKVVQIDGSNATTLYTADGAVNPNAAPSITTSDNSVFNGLTSYSNGDQRALDWSATNLDLALNGIQASSTTIVEYSLTTYVTGGVACSVLASCEGTQVAFGDPRNDGGTPMSQVSSFNSLASFDQPFDPSTTPVIGELFDPYSVTATVVPLDTPLPPPPPVLPAPNYAVPEPATWTMLIAGITLAGAFARRRGAKAPGLAGLG